MPRVRFPPYAYVPKVRPHPTRSERGHSYGVVESITEPMEPTGWQECARYREGVALFNAGYYWEAHEAWEALWIAAGRTGAMGEFFQGLIKLAAAGLKARQQIPASVRSLSGAAKEHFAAAGRLSGRQRIGGLMLAELVDFADAVHTGRTRVRGSPEPRVELVFTRGLEPRDVEPIELSKITTITLRHYDAHAEAFWEGTRHHDVSQNRDAMLRHVEAKAPYRILDLGCGPGRDLIAFTTMGHHAVGLDGSRRLCEMARRHSSCEVLHQDFLSMTLPRSRFDAIFANACLFHVPTARLPTVLQNLRESMVARGVLFCSNPRGDDVEGWQGDRYGAYHSHLVWTSIVCDCGFEELEHYYRPPGQPRHRQPWLATVFRKVSDARIGVP